jgi:dimethylhistidine N-methyltransferase
MHDTASIDIERRPTSSNSVQTDVEDFRSALLLGLSRFAKAVPCRFLYDKAGSDLFDQICRLPEYYPTRTEKGILRNHASDIARRVGPGVRFIELGAGSGGKAEWLIDVLDRPAGYLCIDISPSPLAATARHMAQRYPGLAVVATCADYLADLRLPDRGMVRDLCFFPGSTIGNFERDDARAFLAQWRDRLGPGGMMIVGVDLQKDITVLEQAYDDAQGVTARFSLNVLARANAELGADFDLGLFRHRAIYRSDPGHIEISLVSLADQSVRVAGHTFHFARGEALHIENSHKYTLDEFADMAKSAGFASQGVWTDAADLFSVHLLRSDGR